MMRKVGSVMFGTSLIAGTLIAFGPSAVAGGVSCSSQSHDESNGGRAYASGCNHRGVGERTKLRAYCEWSPFSTHSPTVTGSFTNMSFTTGKCQWGVDDSEMLHNF